jgi:hypothetical protein
MSENKFHANRGVERNKKPLNNIVYEVTIKKEVDFDNVNPILSYLKYKFKEEGYLILHWWYDTNDSPKNWHGFITPDELKSKLGDKQWAKFCQGKRLFIMQRRENGKNIKKVKKEKEDEKG